jgi:hypothetical protein
VLIHVFNFTNGQIWSRGPGENELQEEAVNYSAASPLSTLLVQDMSDVIKNYEFLADAARDISPSQNRAIYLLIIFFQQLPKF